jgi:hypothetical protein
MEPDYQKLYFESEERRRQAEEQLHQVRSQAAEQLQQERQKTEPTTFEEFIWNCHSFLSEPLKIQTNKSLTTKGPVTCPKGRVCPTYLRPWVDFQTFQYQIFTDVHGFLQPSDQPPLRCFSPRFALEDLGRRVCRRRLASEADLQSYERFAVEDEVYDVITALRSIPAATLQFRLGDEIHFENHANTLDSDLDTPNTEEASARKWTIPDQFCVHRVDQDTSTLLYTIEYKPAHKLSADYLRYGLREMNFWEEVVQRFTIPTDKYERLQYDADRLTGAAVTQVFSGMIKEGIAYACLTNGQSKVFLYVDEDDPETLYYALTEPNMDVNAAGDQMWVQYPITAVSRMCSFTLMSLKQTPRNQIWRNNAISQLRTWEVDFEYILSQISDSEIHSSPPGSEYIPSSPPSSTPSSSPPARTAKRRGCRPDAVEPHISPDSSESEAEGPRKSGRKRNLSELTSSPPQVHTRNTKPIEDRGSEEDHRSAWQYCTQACLMGLQSKDLLDNRCPNVKLHRCDKDTDRHLIDPPTLAQLLKKQLDMDLDHYCTAWGTSGSCGAPFKLTLSSHGYTFVGKGTTNGLRNKLLYEADVYRVLRKAQGSAVPVFLGSIDLANIFFLHGGACIKHMMLLSWGGKQADLVLERSVLSRELEKSQREIRALGVYHVDDQHGGNYLWNPEQGRVQIIDYHDAKLIRARKTKRQTADGVLLKRVKRHRHEIATKRVESDGRCSPQQPPVQSRLSDDPATH